MTDFPPLDERLYRDLIAGTTATLPLPDRAVWKVTGADRARYLNGQITHDVLKLAPGHSLYGAALTGKGKIVGDLFVAATPDALWIDAPLALCETLRERFEKFLIADDAAFDDATEAGRLSHVFGTERPPEAPGRVVSANARFGLPGFDVWAAGAKFFRGGEAVPAALADLLRIEAALAAWGREIDANTLPQEVLFDRNGRGLSYEKGCYVGQETVARLRSIGHVNRRLAFLQQVAGPEAAPEPGPLRSGEEEAGRLTSAARSPGRGGVALGLIGRKHLEGGREFAAGEYRYRIAEPLR